MRINHRKPILLRSFFAIACGIVLTAFAACGGDESSALDEELLHVGDPVAISIVASGIESFVGSQESGTRAEGGARLTTESRFENSEQTVCTQTQPLDDGRVMVATVKASKPVAAADAGGADGGAAGTRATTTPLTNTTLRVVVYNSDGKYVDDCLYNVDNGGIVTARSDQSLVVPVQTAPYWFYCYAPGECGYNTDTKVVNVGATDEFAFGSVGIIVNSTTGAQTVAFPMLKLKCARMKLVVTDYHKRPVTCTATLNNGMFAKSATFDLTTGNYSAQAVQPRQFDANNTEIVIPASGRVDIGAMTLTFPTLKIGDAPVTLPPIPFGNFDLTSGVRYTLSIDIRQPQGLPWIAIPSIGLKVAGGNLMRANGTGKWYQAPDQGYYTSNAKGGDYFCWGIDNPLTIGDGSGTNMNSITAGCVAVLGPGWRVPTKAENQKLASLNSVWEKYFSARGVVWGRYFGTTSAPAFAYQNDVVFLPAAGYRYYDGSMFYDGSGGYYWSSEPYGSGYAYGLYFSGSSVYGAGNNFSRVFGHSVRCVAGI